VRILDGCDLDVRILEDGPGSDIVTAEEFGCRKGVGSIALALMLPLMLGGCFSAAIPDRKATVAETPKPAPPPPALTVSATVREHQRIVGAYNGVYEDPRPDTLIRDTVDKLVSASERPDHLCS